MSRGWRLSRKLGRGDFLVALLVLARLQLIIHYGLLAWRAGLGSSWRNRRRRRFISSRVSVEARLTLIRLILSHLLLRGGDDAEIVLGVLVKFSAATRIARTQRIAVRRAGRIFGEVRSGANES